MNVTSYSTPAEKPLATGKKNAKESKAKSLKKPITEDEEQDVPESRENSGTTERPKAAHGGKTVEHSAMTETGLCTARQPLAKRDANTMIQSSPLKQDHERCTSTKQKDAVREKDEAQVNSVSSDSNETSALLMQHGKAKDHTDSVPITIYRIAGPPPDLIDNLATHQPKIGRVARTAVNAVDVLTQVFGEMVGRATTSLDIKILGADSMTAAEESRAKQAWVAGFGKVVHNALLGLTEAFEVQTYLQKAVNNAKKEDMMLRKDIAAATD
ncbi:hypothetical protein LTR28_005532 [Elasticomyces elasticus]|nr:hypothetical protein LTR28_005532 [Elasticomyces elasticus]